MEWEYSKDIEKFYQLIKLERQLMGKKIIDEKNRRAFKVHGVAYTHQMHLTDEDKEYLRSYRSEQDWNK